MRVVPASSPEEIFAPAEFVTLEHTAHSKLFENQRFVWEALKQIASYLQFRLKPAVLGQLRAKRNWHRIAREWVYADTPATELGELEWDYFEERGVKRTPGLAETF